MMQGSVPDDPQTVAAMRGLAETLEREHISDPKVITERAQHLGGADLEALRYALDVYAQADTAAATFFEVSGLGIPATLSDLQTLVRAAIFCGMTTMHRMQGKTTDEGWPSADEAPPVEADDEDESGRPACGDGNCVLVPSRCDEEHEAVPIEMIPRWANALMKGGEQFEQTPWYVHAHHAAPVVVDGVASDAVTVFCCKDREECSRMIGHCKTTNAFHELEIHSHPPSMRPNLLRFCAKNAFNLK